MVDNLLENDLVVSALQDTIKRGEHGLQNTPGLVKRIIREDRWRERIVRETKEPARFTSFRTFVEKPLIEGLGVPYGELKKLCQDDTEALDLIDQVEQRPVGRPTEILDNIQHFPSGTSAQAALRRLRKDRPDLHSTVIAGEMTPHAAMVEAGFRPKTVTVPATVAGFIRAVLKHLTEAEQRTLRDTLAAMDLGEPDACG